MKLLNALIDKLQATFPPNRVVVLLTPLVFMPAAGAVTAWVATHFPGYELSEGLVIGLAAAAALGGLQLANKWLDQWQHHENIDIQGDLEDQLDSYVDGPEAQAFFTAVGTFHGLYDALAVLRGKVASGGISFEELDAEIGHIGDVITQFLTDHPVDVDEPAAPVASPPAEAVPPAAPQPAE